MFKWIKTLWKDYLNYMADIPKQYIQRTSISGKPLVIYYARTLNNGWKVESTEYGNRGGVLKFYVKMNPVKNFEDFIKFLIGEYDDYIHPQDLVELRVLAEKVISYNGELSCMDTSEVPFNYKDFSLTWEQLELLKAVYNKKKL